MTSGRLGVALLGAAALAAMSVAAVPAAAAHRTIEGHHVSPAVKAKTVAIHARLILKGSYYNHEQYGMDECNASTSEEAPFDSFTYIRKAKITEESGFHQIYQDQTPGGNHKPWTITGTQYIQGNDCSSPNTPLDCSGKVVYPGGAAAAPALAVQIKGGTIKFAWVFDGAFTEDKKGCGSKDGEGFYYGLSDFLAPYEVLVGQVSLKSFAKNPTKVREIAMKPEHISKKYDPADCNGTAAHYTGATCTGGGLVKTTLELGAPIKK